MDKNFQIGDIVRYMCQKYIYDYGIVVSIDKYINRKNVLWFRSEIRMQHSNEYLKKI